MEQAFRKLFFYYSVLEGIFYYYGTPIPGGGSYFLLLWNTYSGSYFLLLWKTYSERQKLFFIIMEHLLWRLFLTIVKHPF